MRNLHTFDVYAFAEQRAFSYCERQSKRCSVCVIWVISSLFRAIPPAACARILPLRGQLSKCHLHLPQQMQDVQFQPTQFTLFTNKPVYSLRATTQANPNIVSTGTAGCQLTDKRFVFMTLSSNRLVQSLFVSLVC